MEGKIFNVAEILGTESVEGNRFHAWYKEFDRSKFERLCDDAVSSGVPFGCIEDTCVGYFVRNGIRIGGHLIPAVEFFGHNDFKKYSDLRNNIERENFIRSCDRRISYLETLTGKKIN